MGTPYLAWRKRKFLPWKIKALLRVKSDVTRCPFL